ncbi:MAG TPA: thioredoxin family protein [Steroidobacteraceae bacterium]|nr:thioredoxin family protein [Steroidobacteraceae bacterium]
MTTQHRVVSSDEWIEARKKLVVKEKEFTKRRDELSRERRELPWQAITKEYVFDGQDGKQKLPQLFDGRSQLIVYHFMFGPTWEAGCPHCSRWADNFNNVIVHLNHRDVTMIAVSRAPYAKLAAYKKRMGWSFKWVSSFESDFNVDFGVAFKPEEVEKKKAFYNFTLQDPRATEREGVTVFFKDEAGKIFRTYSAYARGIDMMNVDYQYLDLTPKGRDEGDRGPYWVRRHDEYDR